MPPHLALTEDRVRALIREELEDYEPPAHHAGDSAAGASDASSSSSGDTIAPAPPLDRDELTSTTTPPEDHTVQQPWSVPDDFAPSPQQVSDLLVGLFGDAAGDAIAALIHEPIPDNAVPALLVIDPATGAVGADFTGHVHAHGVDLDAGASSSPDAVSKIRWLRTSDGLDVDEVFAYDNVSTRGIAERVLNDDASIAAAYEEWLTKSTSIVIHQLTAGALIKRLLSSDGKSDWLQLMPPSPANLAIEVGSFSFTSAAAVQWSQAISFGTAFSAAPSAVLVIPTNGVNLYGWSAGTYTSGGFTLIGRWLDGTTTAKAVSGIYVALGPR